MKRVVKISLFVAMMMVAIVSCSKDDSGDSDLVSDAFNGTIKAQVENGNAYNAQFVSVVAVHAPYVANGELKGEYVAEGVYSKGGFTITLPSTIPDSKLTAITEFFKSTLKVTGSLKYSVTSAKVYDTDFIPFDDDDDPLAANFLYTSDDESVVCFFVYVNKDVIVTGGKNITVSLEKGWTRLYYSEAGKGFVTTEAPGRMKWIVEKW